MKNLSLLEEMQLIADAAVVPVKRIGTTPAKYSEAEQARQNSKELTGYTPEQGLREMITADGDPMDTSAIMEAAAGGHCFADTNPEANPDSYLDQGMDLDEDLSPSQEFMDSHY